MRLHEAAEQRWRRLCPCCGQFMTRPVGRGRTEPLSMRTCGHVDAVARGGDPRQWLYVCKRCNRDQHWLSFAAFARMLILRNDPRANRVVEVARFIQAWREKRRQIA